MNTQQSIRWTGWLFQTALLVLLGLLLTAPVRADWQTITTPGINVTQSYPLFDRITGIYSSTVTIINQTGANIPGEFRLVITSSNKTALNPNGTAADGKPFYNLLIGDGSVFKAGQTLSKTLQFSGGRGQLAYAVRLENKPPTSVEKPVITVSPLTLAFGDVVVGTTVDKPITVSNTGTASLAVNSIQASNAPFSVFPPAQFNIPAGGPARTVSLGFAPTAAGEFSATVIIEHNAGNPVTVALSGRGVLPTSPGNISAPTSAEFGSVPENITAALDVTVTNTGNGPLTVSGAATDNPAFQILNVPGNTPPFTLATNESRNLRVQLTPPSNSGGTTVTGNLAIGSNDPNRNPLTVALSAAVVATPLIPPANNPVLGAQVTGNQISAAGCGNVSGSVQFSAAVQGGEMFRVVLTDQGGVTVASGQLSAPGGADTAAFSGINACNLADGVITVSVIVTRGGTNLSPVPGTPTVKNPSPATLAPPVLEPVQPVTLIPTVKICGTSRASTTVRIEGGASIQSITLDNATTHFCLDVPLRPNQQNTLIVSAIDDLAAAPKPVASAPPVQVVNADPSQVVVASASSRPLTTEEVETLVQNGVIKLDNPSNYNVSMFTIVLTIGSVPVTITQPVPVPVPTNPGDTSVSFGRGGSGWGDLALPQELWGGDHHPAAYRTRYSRRHHYRRPHQDLEGILPGHDRVAKHLD